MPLELGDPLAHRALQALLRAEAAVRRRLAAELSREGVSAAGFSVLVVLTTAGGTLELRTLRRRLGWSKANATEVTGTLEDRGLVRRRRDPADRRIVVVDLTAPGAVWSSASSPSTPTASHAPSARSTRARSARSRRSAASWPPSRSASAARPDVGDPQGHKPGADPAPGDPHPHGAEVARQEHRLVRG